MAQLTTIRLGTIDISRYVVGLPSLAEQTAEYGQLIVEDLPTMTGENGTGFWDARNPASPFFGSKLSDLPISAARAGVQVWGGRIQGIRADARARTAEITLRSSIQRKLDSGAIYFSGTDTNPSDTPAHIAQRICALYGIPFDSGTFGRSHGIYARDNALISAHLILPELTVRDALQQIANIGCARVYWDGEALRFEAWEQRTAPPIIMFSDDPANPARLFVPPMVEPLEKQEAGGYSIQWLGGVAPFGAEQLSISAGADAPFRIRSLQGAVWFGELWLEYLQTQQKRITFGVSAAYGRALRLGYPVGIEYSGGGWGSLETVDVVSIDNSSELVSTITGLTR